MIRVIFVLTLSFFAALTSNAIDIQWTGAAQNGAWEDPNNWSPAQVPGCRDIAIVGNNGNVTITTPASVKGLVVQTGLVTHTDQLLELGSEGLVLTTITGTFVHGSGDIIHEGDLDIAGGDFISGTGQVYKSTNPIVCLNTNVYVALQDQLGAGYYYVDDNQKLHFAFKDKYNLSTLEYKIYDYTRAELSGTQLINDDFGLYTINLGGVSNWSPVSPFYVLEVNDGKGRIYKLRFKYIN